MKKLKFGAFFLGLAVLVGIAVAGLSAQDRVEVRQGPARGHLMMLDGRGSQLGVMVSDLDPSTSPGAGAGVEVDEVTSDSAAEKAGLKAGDVVVEFDGERVRSARQFTRLVQETPDGRTVKIAILREVRGHIDPEREHLPPRIEELGLAHVFAAEAVVGAHADVQLLFVIAVQVAEPHRERAVGVLRPALEHGLHTLPTRVAHAVVVDVLRASRTGEQQKRDGQP